MLPQYRISIDARVRLRNSTISVKAETAECLVERVMLRLFMYILNNSDSGRFLCVNAYLGASIHLILFFVSNHGKTRNMVNKNEEFTKGIFSTHN